MNNKYLLAFNEDVRVSLVEDLLKHKGCEFHSCSSPEELLIRCADGYRDADILMSVNYPFSRSADMHYAEKVRAERAKLLQNSESSTNLGKLILVSHDENVVDRARKEGFTVFEATRFFYNIDNILFGERSSKSPANFINIG